MAPMNIDVEIGKGLQQVFIVRADPTAAIAMLTQRLDVVPRLRSEGLHDPVEIVLIFVANVFFHQCQARVV
jgi:hypothetical protein